MTVDAQPLSGTLVVELAWYLPVAYAGWELARLGARVVRVEPQQADPLCKAAPGGIGRCGKGRSPCSAATPASDY